MHRLELVPVVDLAAVAAATATDGSRTPIAMRGVDRPRVEQSFRCCCCSQSGVVVGQPHIGATPAVTLAALQSMEPVQFLFTKKNRNVSGMNLDTQRKCFQSLLAYSAKPHSNLLHRRQPDTLRSSRSALLPVWRGLLGRRLPRVEALAPFCFSPTLVLSLPLPFSLSVVPNVLSFGLAGLSATPTV